MLFELGLFLSRFIQRRGPLENPEFATEAGHSIASGLDGPSDSHE
jgi:hypothetical protein